MTKVISRKDIFGVAFGIPNILMFGNTKKCLDQTDLLFLEWDFSFGVWYKHRN